MFELRANLLDLFEADPTAAFCVTTNCQQFNGKAVMGGGTAALFAKRFSGIDLNLGKLLVEKNYGVCQIWNEPTVFAYPTKFAVMNDSIMELIVESAKQLVELTKGFNRVYLPAPGIGLGSLSYSDVKPAIEPILSDDRFIVLQWP